MTFDQLAPWVSIATLLVSIAAIVISYKDRRYNAHKTFRSAFTTDISTLREMEISRSEPAVFHFLQDAYPRHEAAYLEYLHSLGWDFISKKRLRDHWLTYRGKQYGESEDQQYRLAHFLSETEAEERQKRDEAIRLIEKLIA